MDIKTYISSGIIEEYALGILPQEEASILECVMKNNKEVLNAVLEAQKTLELLADAEAVQAPSELKSQIFAKLDFAKPVENISQATEKEIIATPIIPLNKKSGGNNFSKFALVAASLLLLASLGYNLYTSKNQKQELANLATNNTILTNQVSELKNQNQMILNSKNIKLNGVAAHPGMLANVYWDQSKKVYLKVNNLPTAPAGQQYQLWAIVDGKPVSAGMFDGNHPDEIQSMAVIDKAQAFAITLEKAGGVDSPTMENMMVMGTT